MIAVNHSIILGVHELYTDKALLPPRYALPTLCVLSLNSHLIAIIGNAKTLLIDKELSEITIQTTAPLWYFQLTNRYHHDIKTFAHIGHDFIRFSGILRPYREPHFITPKIPISSLHHAPPPIKQIDLAQLSIPLARSLVKEINNLNDQYSRLDDLYWSIDPVVEEIRKLDISTEQSLSLESDSALESLNKQSNELDEQKVAVNTQLEILSMRLLFKVFGISKGDWVSFIPRVDHSPQRLHFEYCEIFDNVLTITGAGITQNGKLGKRKQHISIELVRPS